jgi:hypothetical protein
VSVSTVFDDLANRRHLSEVLALSGKGELGIGRLRRMATGAASSVDIEKHGDYWLLTLVDLLQRGGVGSLERRTDGVVFVFADLDELPSSPEEAWARSQSEVDDFDP